MKTPHPTRLAAIILPQRRLPQPIRDLLRFFLIGAVVGAVYGHISPYQMARRCSALAACRVAYSPEW